MYDHGPIVCCIKEGHTMGFSMPACKEHHIHRVALIDDDSSFRKATERLLRAYGWDTQSFVSAIEFLNATDGREFSCLVVDNQMPRLSGCELLGLLRSRGIDTPCLIVSAHELNPVQLAIADKYAQKVLAKPSEAEALISALEAACA